MNSFLVRALKPGADAECGRTMSLIPIQFVREFAFCKSKVIDTALPFFIP
jgi:hypothetical protein